MFKFIDPKELLKEGVGLVNIIARDYNKKFAKQKGISPPVRYDALTFLPELYNYFDPDSGRKLINILKFYFINADMDTARYCLSTLSSELKRVTCSAAIMRYAKKHNGKLSLHFTMFDNFTVRDLTPEEIKEMEKDWKTAI